MKNFIYLFLFLPFAAFSYNNEQSANVYMDGDGTTYMYIGEHLYIIQQMYHSSKCTCQKQE